MVSIHVKIGETLQTYKFALRAFHDREVQARFVALDKLDQLLLDQLRPRRVGGVEAEQLWRVVCLLALDFALLDAERFGELSVPFRDRARVVAFEESAFVPFWLLVACSAASVLRQMTASAVDRNELGTGRIGGACRREMASCRRKGRRHLVSILARWRKSEHGYYTYEAGKGDRSACAP